MPPRYNVDVKRATYKPMEVDSALARNFARETDDIATALTGFLSAEIEKVNVFVLGKNGKLTRLFDPDVEADAESELEFDDYLKHRDDLYNKMASAALSNCLFVQHSGGGLHQVGMTTEGEEIDVTVSKAVKALPLPESPGFLARFLSWFGHKESVEKVKAYDEVKNFNDAFSALARKAYGVKLDPEKPELKSGTEIRAEKETKEKQRRQQEEEAIRKIEERELEEQRKLAEQKKLEEEKKLAEQKKLEEEKKKLEEEQNAKEKNEVPMTNEEWENKILEEVNQEPIKDTRNMSADEFYNYLVELGNTSEIFVMEQVEKKNATPIDYYKNMVNSMVRAAAGEILEKADDFRHNGNKDVFLRNSKDIFTSMNAGLRNYVVKNTDHNLVRNYFADRDNYSNWNDLRYFVQNFNKNCLTNYKLEVKKQNREMEEALKQSRSQPQNNQVQAEQGAAQMQQSEPQAKPAAPSMGGGGMG